MRNIPSTLLSGLFSGCLLAGTGAHAADSTIVAMYKDCQPVSRTIFIDEQKVPPVRAGQIIAHAERDARGLGFDQALTRIIAVLESYGLRDTEVNRLGECAYQGSGKFVEVVAAYCNGSLTSAEIHVDGKLFLRRNEPDTSIDAFIDNSVVQLRKAGISDRPRVTINNAPDCVETEPGS